MTRPLACLIALFVFAVAPGLHAEDWPEYRGAGRTGEWRESGILQRFPADGLTPRWRTPVKEGYSSPVVADGRVFITDFERATGHRGTERAVALDERTGRILWTVEWDADYGGFVWPNGPRATPTVDGDRVYVLGARGVLQCIDVETGAVRWKRDYAAEYGVGNNGTGAASAPIVDGPRLISIVGGEPDALVVAWDKFTGEEVWRALETSYDPGVGQPIIVTAGGARQLIIWTLDGVRSLDPATGTVYWMLPFKAMPPMNIPVPVFADNKLLVSNFYTGSMLAQLDETTPTARMLWQGKSDSEISTDGLHAVIGTPIIIGDHLYGTCSYGQLRCLRVSTGERLWETQAVTVERARWASAHIVKNGDRVFISNDRGELMIARLTADGYQEIDRTHLLKPTSPPGIRRRLENVTVVHPAYANRHVVMRNDEEVISVSLAAETAPVSTSSIDVVPAPAAGVASARSVLPTAGNAVELQYIPSLTGTRKMANRDAEYSSLYMVLGGGTHSLVFTSENGVVIVNTKPPGWGQAILDKLPEITEAPVSLIINTHSGIEYTGNNGAFPEGVTIVAQENTLRAMRTMPAFTGAGAGFLPNRTFTDKLSLFEGKSQVDVYHFGAAHTDGDAVVTIPASNLAYLGELLPAKETPIVDRARGGSAVAFPETLRRALEVLKANDIEFIVSGRAEPRRGAMQIDVMNLRDLEEYINFNQAFLDAARDSLQAGKTVDEAADTLVLPDAYRNYGMSRAKANIQAIYDELAR